MFQEKKKEKKRFLTLEIYLTMQSWKLERVIDMRMLLKRKKTTQKILECKFAGI